LLWLCYIALLVPYDLILEIPVYEAELVEEDHDGAQGVKLGL